MIAAASFSAFAAPIGSSSLSTPPMRMAPVNPTPQSSAPQPAPAPVGPGPMPRGSLLNMSV
ncbi:hypothetical protein AruPA_13675 [Acidiphilium sp. PA]|uniref:hypothetical protein n=1 Tax=Acidiphilium sp. PA TaxID=2871705 RepID=UPI002243E8E4|nr:hypothetical protein [Acidiphilium sp. PA]MCW8308090.1 hypothetical protein [Acidiphilium sp. PA]